MIIGAYGKITDGQGSLQTVHALLDRLKENDLACHSLKIAPLGHDWHLPLPENMIRSACTPMQAVGIARDLFNSGKADALLLEGKDHLATGYTKDERLSKMKCFKNGETHFEGYVEVARSFAEKQGLTPNDFQQIAAALFDNYLRSSTLRYPDRPRPQDRWHQLENPYFRGVDCANPYIDFEGAVLFLSEKAVKALGLDGQKQIKVIGNQLKERGKDDLESIPLLTDYSHIKEVFDGACAEADLDFKAEFQKGNTHLETYTCYPVVPMGFLTASGLVDDVRDIPDFLKDHLVTVTGGLNLNRAAWNNTTLGNIIDICTLLDTDPSRPYAGIHGNGSLGYQQGFMILEKR